MGLDASVMCNCFSDPRAEPPVFAANIRVDQEGYLFLHMPYEDNQATHRLFRQWYESGCEHPLRQYASEGIANWTGYRAFQQSLAKAGWEHFPTLKSELPENNGGMTSSLAAAEILKELSFFTEQAQLGMTTVLIDTETGEELHQCVASYERVFINGISGIDIGIDERGFFIRTSNKSPSGELFRSMRFEQKILIQESPSDLGQVEYTDLENGQRRRCNEPMYNISDWPDGRMQNDEGQFRVEVPARMHVLTRPSVAAEFEYILNPLRRICLAAVETGNPIRWL